MNDNMNGNDEHSYEPNFVMQESGQPDASDPAPAAAAAQETAGRQAPAGETAQQAAANEAGRQAAGNGTAQQAAPQQATVNGTAQQAAPQQATVNRTAQQAAPQPEPQKWNPQPEQYNTAPKPEKPKKEKKHGRGWIPAVIIMGCVILAMIGCMTVQSVRINKLTEKVKSQELREVGSDDGSAGDDANTLDTGSGDGQFTLEDVSGIVDSIMPAVVSITSRTLVSNGGFYNPFSGSYSSGSSQEVDSGLGSGTIVGQNDTELLILTCYHVIDGCSSLYVTFNDDTSVDGYVKSESSGDDIAIVAVPIDNISEDTLSQLAYAEISDEAPYIGEGCIVVGNALGLGMSVTTGIVSATDRVITPDTGMTVTTIQTDAAINSGNSGGCMLNAEGQLIGISEAKISSSSVENMCYAIQASTYYDLIQQLMNSTDDNTEDSTDGGSSYSSQGAYLGIRGRDISSSLSQAYNLPEGVYVVSVTDGGGAAAAGIQSSDIIVSLNGAETITMEELQAALSECKAGDTVTVGLYRSNGSAYQQTEVKVTLTDGSVLG